MEMLEQKTKSVIIIDDQETIVDLLPQTLFKQGYNFKTIFYDSKQMDGTIQRDKIVNQIISENPAYLFCDGLYGRCLDIYKQLMNENPANCKKFILITDSIGVLVQNFKVDEQIPQIVEKNRNGSISKTILTVLEELEKTETIGA